ncbi:unnamed protein product [Euphydryas editha]|uniref:Uncharacterized protein n=1 Tax=Euphydryas editha TaxID=104508 RepID=A0AAU9U858_EUPED|nr:unnamed protein product [Euphydryas editha]
MIPVLYNQTKAAPKQKLVINNIVVYFLITDLWTLRANEAYITVTAHYTEEFDLKTALLECSNLPDFHSSANIQTIVTEIVALVNKIIFFISNNVANMQKALIWTGSIMAAIVTH